jgi:hypothetical protein
VVQMVDSSRARNEPLTLELGVSEIVSNPLLSAIEDAVRSHGVGVPQHLHHCSRPTLRCGHVLGLWEDSPPLNVF